MESEESGHYVLVMGTDVDGILRGKIILKSKLDKRPHLSHLDLGKKGFVYEICRILWGDL
jgi:hypothetical protein